MFNLIHSGSACDLPVENDMVQVCVCFPKCVNQEKQVRSVNYPRQIGLPCLLYTSMTPHKEFGEMFCVFGLLFDRCST